LLVTIDTLRADALGSYGGHAETPNLDRLAAQGARFSFAHAHAVVTLPSHASILTGRLPFEHGIRDNTGYRLGTAVPTLATRLKTAGFATAAFIGGFPLTRRFGLDRGFDLYDDRISEARADVVFTMPERPARQVVSAAGDWIGRHSERFFAWVHLFDPHSPYSPPQDLAARYPGQPYLAEVTSIDRELGPLFDRLERLDRPTLVIVTADHGESLGEHGETTHGMFAYEATLRVPLIITEVRPQSSRTPRGTVVDAAVRHVDLVPTVFDALAMAADPSLPGGSLLPLLQGKRGEDRTTYFEALTYNLVRGWAPLRGVISERRKYIDLPIAELYDLRQDPAEQHNRLASEPELGRSLASLLGGFDISPPRAAARESAEVVERLRALGYVSGSAPARTTYTAADDLKNLVSIDRDIHTASERFQEGRIDDAIGLLKDVLTRRPDTSDASVSLAHIYWESGRPREAIAVLESALRQGSHDRDVRLRLSLYLSESRTDAARALALLETLPDDDLDVLNGRGIAYENAGRFDEAIGSFRQMLAIDPQNALAHQNIGTMMLDQALSVQPISDQTRDRRMREAESSLRRALELDPSLAKAHTALGVLFDRTGREAQAIEAWKQAVALDTAEFDALYNLATVLVRAGRRQEAEVYGERFVAQAPPALYGEAIAEVRRGLRRESPR
jgi:arylsulfatase A-like enzyme/Flp pilus assembly protein TadD